jgi:uncharacterized membrane protein HdeD (DUF308 family)
MPSPAALSAKTIRENRVWFWGGGILFLLIGTVAILMPYLATIGAELFIGALFAVSGVIELVRAFRLRGKLRIAGTALFGLITAIAGVLLLLFPLPGALALTSVIGALFLIGGGLKLWQGFQMRPGRGWGWMAASGGLSVLLAALILLAFPASALWTLGLLVGVDMIGFGAALIALVTGAKGRTEDAA